METIVLQLAWVETASHFAFRDDHYNLLNCFSRVRTLWLVTAQKDIQQVENLPAFFIMSWSTLTGGSAGSTAWIFFFRIFQSTLRLSSDLDILSVSSNMRAPDFLNKRLRHP